MLEISINYNRAITEANRLKTVANECNNAISQSRNALSDQKTYWEGAAANEFASAQERWRKEMQSIGTELTTISNLIRKVVDDIRAADERAAAAAKKE